MAHTANSSQTRGSSVSQSRVDLDRYDGQSDHLLWERQIRGVLAISGMAAVLAKTMPTGMDVAEYMALQVRAVATIELHLRPHILRQTKPMETALEYFVALKAKYHRSDAGNRLVATLELLRFKMEGHTSIQDHIDRFEALTRDMEDLGESLTDERRALYLLASLPRSYDTLNIVLIHRDKTTLSYSDVVQALLTEDSHQKARAGARGGSASSSALQVRDRGRSQSRTRQSGGRG